MNELGGLWTQRYKSWVHPIGWRLEYIGHNQWRLLRRNTLFIITFTSLKGAAKYVQNHPTLLNYKPDKP